jgi:hypothetical protein
VQAAPFLCSGSWPDGVTIPQTVSESNTASDGRALSGWFQVRFGAPRICWRKRKLSSRSCATGCFQITQIESGKRQCWQGFLQLSAHYGETGASRKLDPPSIYVALSGKHRHLLQIDGNLETPA